MLDPLSSPISRDDIAALGESEDFVLSDEDRIAILQSMDSIDVQACPGSGKTTLIALKLILLAKKWRMQDRGICVLSHTNVAKNEILRQIENSRAVEPRLLLSYPHFIGTIQEFANRFLALPVVRHADSVVRFIDGAEGVYEVLKSGEDLRSIYSSLYRKFGGNRSPWPLDQDIFDSIMQSLGSLFWLNSDLDLGFYGPYGNLVSYKNDPTKQVYPKLSSLKTAIEAKGYYQYRDMFMFAEQLLSENEGLSRSIRKRFSFLIIDEMQDTQKFQDDLLCELFPLDAFGSIVQRFGDPDQAIFHRIGNEDPNETFNYKSSDEMNFVINGSYRFDHGLSERIRGFSFNEIPLETELSEAALMDRKRCCGPGEAFEHTAFVFDDGTRREVIEKFAQVVSTQFETGYKQSPNFCVKAVGAVGNEIDPNVEHLKIGHYWPAYKKGKAQGSFRPTSLIEAVQYCRRNSLIDWAENYKTLLACLLKLLRLCGKVDIDGRYFSARSLRTCLEADKKWQKLREGIYMMLDDSYVIDLEFWEGIVRLLSTIFEIGDMPEEAIEYLSFADDEHLTQVEEEDENHDAGALAAMPGNIVRHRDGFSIELSTIHGVKGETHDATLVMETKNYCFDLEAMLPFLVDSLPNEQNPNQDLPEAPHATRAFKPNKRFLRQFYVAMSRPRHLLCLAIHSDRLSAENELLLQNRGWTVRRLSAEPAATKA